MAARVDSWTTRDSDDRRVSVTVVPDGFYFDVEEGYTYWSAARLTPEAAAALAAWLQQRTTTSEVAG